MKDRKRVIAVFILGLLIFIAAIWYNGGNFSGTDVRVDSLVREKSGRVSTLQSRSLVNTSQGDLFLFLFGVTGLVAGFYLGYTWRGIFQTRREGREVGHGTSNNGDLH
ncbi:MAG: hypothetical protein ACYCX4_02355 [Bacillota bacterium]